MTDDRLTTEEIAEIEGRMVMVDGADDLTMQRYGAVCASKDVPRLLRHIAAGGLQTRDISTDLLDLLRPRLQQAFASKGLNVDPKKVEAVKVLSCNVHVTTAAEGSLILDSRIEIRK